MYKVRINNQQVNAHYDTGASISVMAKHFSNKLQSKPKLAKYKRNISNASGKALRPTGECLVQLQIGKKLFRDRILVIQNLKCEYNLVQVLHRAYRYGIGYPTTGRHYITINGEMIADVISQVTDSPILKTKCKIILPPMAISVISVKTPQLHNINYVY